MFFDKTRRDWTIILNNSCGIFYLFRADVASVLNFALNYI